VPCRKKLAKSLRCDFISLKYQARVLSPGDGIVEYVRESDTTSDRKSIFGAFSWFYTIAFVKKNVCI